MHNDDYSYLQQHRIMWQAKPVLRRIYKEQYYRRLLKNLVSGDYSVEIGSGPGFLREIAPAIIRTDILRSPWIDYAVDAHHLPFRSNSVDNLIGLDVLHHFNRPLAMLRESARVVRPGGRVVLIEPWITPVSRFIYTYLHQEQCDLSVQPWLETANQFGIHKHAFDGNAAIPYRLIKAGSKSLMVAIPELKLLSLETFSFLTYLLSLGFKPGNFLPDFLYPIVYHFEEITQPVWENIAALRALIVWEKSLLGNGD